MPTVRQGCHIYHDFDVMANILLLKIFTYPTVPILSSDVVQLCLDSALLRHKAVLQQSDAVLSDSDNSEFIPFIGEFVGHSG